MEKRAEEIIQNICREGVEDDSVLAVILVGSVPKGYSDKHSDVDLELVVKPEYFEQMVQEGKRIKHTDDYDLIYTTEDRIMESISSKKDTDHWQYKGSQIISDKTGSLDRILGEVIKYDYNSRNERLKEYYLGFWGSMLGAISCIQRKKMLESRIYASRSMEYLIGLIFNINSLWAPEIKWALNEFELLEKKPSRLEKKMADILVSPDTGSLSKLWEDVAKILREEGYTWVDHPEQIL